MVRIRNRVRDRASQQPFNRLDPLDLPGLIEKARQVHTKHFRDADRKGLLNEFYGPSEILLDDEEDVDISDMDTCAGIVRMASYRLAGFVRNIFSSSSSNEIATQKGNFDPELGLHERTLSPYCFDIGPHIRRFETSALADAPHVGQLQTYKIVTEAGVTLDIMEVDMPDKSVLNNLLEQNRDVEAQILNEKCATLIWIFEERTQIILVTESENQLSWSPQQWFRKILSDMALADSITIGHPYYWHPVVRRRLSKAVKHFRKLYKTITDQSKVVKEECSIYNEPSARLYRDNTSLVKSESFKYKCERIGRECIKALEYFPHTRTRVIMGNTLCQVATARPMSEVVNTLYEDWAEFKYQVKKGKPFLSLPALVKMEQANEEKAQLAQNQKIKKIVKVASEMSHMFGTRDSIQNAHYNNVLFKSVSGTDDNIMEVVSNKNLPGKFTCHVGVPLHVCPVSTDITAAKKELEIEFIKPADPKIKSEEVGLGAIPKKRFDKAGCWKESTNSDYLQSHSESTGLSDGFGYTISPKKSRSRASKSSKGKPGSGSGSSWSDSFLDKNPPPKGATGGPPCNIVEPETSDRAGHSSRHTSRRKHRRRHEGRRRSDEDEISGRNEASGGMDVNQLGDDTGSALKLGPSKTRHSIDHSSPSLVEIGPPLMTFNEPFVVSGNFFGFGMQHHEYNASEIPPADADSVPKLAPHGLNSRERLPGVVNQLGLETPSIPTIGHPNVQQHRGGSGPRNPSNFQGAYQAVSQNKSLESLDLGQPLIALPSHIKIKRGKVKTIEKRSL